MAEERMNSISSAEVETLKKEPIRAEEYTNYMMEVIEKNV